MNLVSSISSSPLLSSLYTTAAVTEYEYLLSILHFLLSSVGEEEGKREYSKSRKRWRREEGA